VTPAQYQAKVAAIARKTEKKTTAVVRASLTADQFDVDKTAYAVGRIVAASNLATSLLGEQFVADHFNGFSDIATYKRGGPGRPPDDEQRVITAVYAILRRPDEGDQVQRIARLAVSEPEQAARDAVARSMKKRKVTRYRWQVDDDPCPECIDRSKKTYPMTEPPASHPHCNCTPVPILKG
jgi:cell wall-associated NlpC family hydrolase